MLMLLLQLIPTNDNPYLVTAIAAAITNITVIYWQPGGAPRYRAKWDFYSTVTPLTGSYCETV